MRPTGTRNFCSSTTYQRMSSCRNTARNAHPRQVCLEFVFASDFNFAARRGQANTLYILTTFVYACRFRGIVFWGVQFAVRRCGTIAYWDFATICRILQGSNEKSCMYVGRIVETVIAFCQLTSLKQHRVGNPVDWSGDMRKTTYPLLTNNFTIITHATRRKINSGVRNAPPAKTKANASQASAMWPPSPNTQILVNTRSNWPQ